MVSSDIKKEVFGTFSTKLMVRHIAGTEASLIYSSKEKKEENAIVKWIEFSEVFLVTKNGGRLQSIFKAFSPDFSLK